jgi:hypothetical protein
VDGEKNMEILFSDLKTDASLLLNDFFKTVLLDLSFHIDVLEKILLMFLRLI